MRSHLLFVAVLSCSGSKAPVDKPPLGPEPGDETGAEAARKTAVAPDAGARALESVPVLGPAGGTLEARAPTAADLATYIGDLGGTGPLTATLETAQGTLHCELFEKAAPMTVANFVGLARGLHPFIDPVSGKVEKRPYYDGTFFHRVIPGFMAQGGDPTATGTGGPGYKFASEISPELRHLAGTLSMANAGPDTNGGQFFITEKAQPRLDGSYNVFGRCKEIAVVKKLTGVRKVDQPGVGKETSRPANPADTLLVRVTISR
jgi:peptidyl-prolyl cis-trans isomerase A (cyclophilin A)